MRVFAAERDAGLSGLLEKSVAKVQAPLRLSKTPDVDKLIAHLERLAQASAVKDLVGIEQSDLALIDAILVSTGWNLNDDVFLPEETYAARLSPVHKPINVEHDETVIIGHLITSRAINKDGSELVVEADKPVPTEFDLEVAGVMYKDLPAIAEQIAEIIEAAQKGELFVSMEVWFDDFAYAIKDSAGKTRIVARNDETAFLTKHLRYYGGTGQYEGCALGRVLRTLNFAGVGIVDNPANPESVIKKVAARAAATRMVDNELRGGAQSMADQNPTAAADTAKAEELQTKLTEAETAMQAEAEKAKTLAAEIETLKAKITGQGQALEAKANELVEATKASETAIAELQTKLDEATKRADTAEAAAKKSKDEMDQMKKDKKAQCRLAELAKVRTVADEKATLAELAEMSDETFASVLKYAGEKSQAGTTTTTEPEKKDGQTATAALDNAEPVTEPDLNAGAENESETLMKTAKATASALLRRPSKNEE